MTRPPFDPPPAGAQPAKGPQPGDEAPGSRAAIPDAAPKAAPEAAPGGASGAAPVAASPGAARHPEPVGQGLRPPAQGAARRYAANLLWTPRAMVPGPLLTLESDGSLTLARCDEPDRCHATVFLPGVMVAAFPTDVRGAFDRLLEREDTPLAELLAHLSLALPAAWHAAFEALAAEASGAPPRGVAHPLPPIPGTVCVVLSGLRTEPLRLGPRSGIEILK